MDRWISSYRELCKSCWEKRFIAWLSRHLRECRILRLASVYTLDIEIVGRHVQDSSDPVIAISRDQLVMGGGRGEGRSPSYRGRTPPSSMKAFFDPVPFHWQGVTHPSKVVWESNPESRQ